MLEILAHCDGVTEHNEPPPPEGAIHLLWGEDAVACARWHAVETQPELHAVAAALIRCVVGSPYREAFGQYHQDWYVNLVGGCEACWNVGNVSDPEGDPGDVMPCPQCCTPIGPVPEYREAVRLAALAYEGRCADPLTLLAVADALEEAGCRGPALAHLREPGPHVRGCWAVDLTLRKE